MPFHDLSGARIHYRISGSQGPAFVLIHGGCCTLADWRLQIEAMSPDARILAIDLRGHGASTGAVETCSVDRWASDVNALIAALQPGPAVIVGHSLGARIAAEAAFQAPGNAAALVMVDGSRSVGGAAASGPAVRATAPLPQSSELATILETTIGAYADAETRRGIIAAMSAAPMAMMLQTVAAYSDWDEHRADAVFAALAGKLPVLAIQSTYHDRFTPRYSLGKHDPTTPYLEFLKAAVPQLEVAILVDTGHFSMLEKPDEVTALLRRMAPAPLALRT